MTNLDEIKAQALAGFQVLLDSREPVLPRWPAIQGLVDTQGNADVGSLSGWVYVRIGNAESIGTAFNNRTSHRNGLAVWVGYLPEQPTLFQVTNVRQPYHNEQAEGESVAPHHAQHEWGNTSGGEDIMYSRIRQIVDCRVYADDPASLTVNIADGAYGHGDDILYYGGGSEDLTAYVPSLGRRWALISLNGSEEAVVTAGTIVYGTPAMSDIPAAPDSANWRIAAVRLSAGQTAITDWPSTQHIYDLRFVFNTTSSGFGQATSSQAVAALAHDLDLWKTLMVTRTIPHMINQIVGPLSHDLDLVLTKHFTGG